MPSFWKHVLCVGLVLAVFFTRFALVAMPAACGLEAEGRLSGRGVAGGGLQGALLAGRAPQAGCGAIVLELLTHTSFLWRGLDLPRERVLQKRRESLASLKGTAKGTAEANSWSPFHLACESQGAQENWRHHMMAMTAEHWIHTYVHTYIHTYIDTCFFFISVCVCIYIYIERERMLCSWATSSTSCKRRRNTI